ncbi:uncharacterized protein METZ01_LOCUS377572, partial [marine metagenome]
MIYKNILILIYILISQVHAQNESEYVIFTTSGYEVAAEMIAKLHREDVEENYQLTTDIV